MATHIYESSTTIKQFRDNLNLNDNASVLQGTDDPTSVAKSAPQGSIYMQTGSSGGRVFVKLDSGSSTNWEEIGTGSSAGLNFIENGDAENSTVGWSTYADGATAIPVDGTGGGPGITWTRSTSSPLNGIASFVLTKGAFDRQGQGVSYDFTLPSGYTKRKCKISWVHEGSANVVFGESSDMRVYVYDVTNTTILVPQGNVGPNFWNNRYGEAVFDATDSTSYRLIFHIATTNANSWTIKFDDIVVAPLDGRGVQLQSDWVAYTPTGTWSTASSYAGFYRRNGDSLDVVGYVTTTAGPTAATLYINNPTGFTTDTTKLSTAMTTQSILGVCQIYDASATTTGYLDAGVVILDSSSRVQLIYSNNSGTAGAISNTSPITFANGDIVSFRYTIPVTGFSTGNQVVNNKTFRLTEAVTMTRVTGSAPTALGQYRSYLRNAGALTYTETNGSPGTTPSASNGILIYGSSAGFANADPNNNPSRYDIFVGKNKYVRTQHYGTTGRTGTAHADWGLVGATCFGTTESYDPTAGILYVIVPGSSSATSNILSYRNASGVGAADHYFDVEISETPLPALIRSTEYLAATSSTKTPSATNHYHALTSNSLALTPGSWLLYGSGNFSSSGGAAAYTNVTLGWYAANGADSSSEPSTLTLQANNYKSFIQATTAGDLDLVSLNAPTVRITVATPTTVYLVSYATMTTAANSRITVYPAAERMP